MRADEQAGDAADEAMSDAQERVQAVQAHAACAPVLLGVVFDSGDFGNEFVLVTGKMVGMTVRSPRPVHEAFNGVIEAFAPLATLCNSILPI